MSARPKIRALYIEDDPAAARLFQRTFSRLGHEAAPAANGEEGLHAWESGDYDVLIVDHDMPKMKGLEVVRTLAAKGSLPPTVMITGAGDERVAVEAMKLGVEDYLVKTCGDGYLDLLVSAVVRALERKRLREEKEAAQYALRESEERHRLLAEHATDIISRVSPEGTILYASPAARRLLGYDVETDLLGRSFYEFCHPDDLDIIEAAHKRLLKSAGSVTATFRLKRKDGVFTWHETTANAVQDAPSGLVREMVAVSRDVSLRKKAEDALKEARDQLELRVAERTAELSAVNEALRSEIASRSRAEEALALAHAQLKSRAEELQLSEQRFRAIFDSAQDCIFVKDLSLSYVMVNPFMESFLELPASEILGRKDEELFPRGEGLHAEGIEHRVLKGESVEVERTSSMRGERFTLLETRIPMRNSEGNVVGLFGISRNITERSRKPWSAGVEQRDPRSKVMRRTLGLARTVARTEATVLLTGESGAGKDYIARYIHENSTRAGGPFFSLNCSALPHELAESELFGHEPGAFTGARKAKKGLLELAEGGTLLLNEVGELPLPLQAKLLTFMDTRTFVKVGGEKSVSVDVRLIAATNRDLRRAVGEGLFREDLFYRLNVVSIIAPPLRERKEDIPELVRSLAREIAARLQLKTIPEIDSEIMEALTSYSWPGNVRELKNVLERGFILSQGNRFNLGAVGLTAPAATDAQSELSLPEGRSLNDLIADMKMRHVKNAMRVARGNRNQAAKMLGLTRYSLTRMMKSLGMLTSETDPGERPGPEGPAARGRNRPTEITR
jgi:PAS domain S-box-containing protein